MIACLPDSAPVNVATESYHSKPYRRNLHLEFLAQQGARNRLGEGMAFQAQARLRHQQDQSHEW
jgi:hypothetical protein